MDTFLDTASFLGASIDAGAASVIFAGQAIFNGCITFSNWPRRDVEALLPDELELAVNTSPTADVHPVCLIFGEQTHGATMFAGLTFPMGVHYHEFAFAVPFVKLRGGQYLHTYVPRMYSSYFPAVWHGNTYYGFAKQLARMWWQGAMFLVTAEDDALLLHAAVERIGEWTRPGVSVLPNFQGLRAIFALPIVGRRSLDTYSCSYWDWDFREAVVRPADASISIDAPLCPGLSPRRCDDVSHGTFDVQGMVWRLSWPAQCRF